MAEFSEYTAIRRAPINWGKWLLIGTGILFSVLLLVIPIVWIFLIAFSKGLEMVTQNLFDPDMLHAIWLTVMIALITVPINLVFGVMTAWLVTRFSIPRQAVTADISRYPVCGFSGGGGAALSFVLRC